MLGLNSVIFISIVFKSIFGELKPVANCACHLVHKSC